MKVLQSLSERFLSKVSPEPMSGCWLWTGCIFGTGYGTINTGSRTDGTRRNAFAHRVSWELANGPIPAGLSVCHRCDNTLCVNPAHLFLGTHAENMRDMVAKGRRRGPVAPTHCPQGHQFTEANTSFYRGWRHCRECHRVRERDRKKRKRQRAQAPGHLKHACRSAP